ncbi:MAG: hypothetical protein QM739_00255 [Propionivibrio sp.]
MTARRVALCIILAACAGVALAAEPSPANSPNSAPSPAPGAVAQAASRAGVLACAGRIDQVSQFIGANAKVGAYFFAPPAPPDQRLVSFSYEVQPQTANAPPAYASASFAPNQANGSGAVYEAVVYWPQKCNTVAARQFAQFRKGRSLQKDVLVLESETPARIFLMPAGSGCVSIKKELVM